MTGEADNVVRVKGLVARMDDGTCLVADAWHPAGEGPWPVLLQRLPYGRASASTPVLPHPAWFARRGYAVVVQDVRGCGDSEGTFEPFVFEGADGATTIEWAARLPFSNGEVVTYGFSYQGLNQLYAAALQPPSLRAIAPMMCSPDPYEGWTYEHGCLRWSFVAEWAAQLASLRAGAGRIAADLQARPRVAALGPEPPSWFLDWLAHPDDDEYWAARRPDLSRITVPAFSVLGWFDDFAGGTGRLIEALDAEAVCGPWVHMPWGTRLGDLEFGEAADGRVAAEGLVSFLGRVLKRRAARSPDRIRYFAPGSGWLATDSWPPPVARRTLTATSNGDANSRNGSGRLSWEAAAYGPPDTFVVDAANPYPASPPLTSEVVAEDRRDVLSYTSAPLSSPLTVAGVPAVELAVSADDEEQSLVAALLVVDDTGASRCISAGAVRVDRQSPGSTTGIRFALGPTAWTIEAGSQLRLDISGDRFPYVTRPVRDANPSSQVTVELSRAVLDLPVSPG